VPLRAALFSLLLACAGGEKTPRTPAAAPPPPPVQEADAGVSGEANAAEQDRTLRAGQGDPAYLGVLDRKGLSTVIDQGLGRVLARLKLSPAMRNGRYEGFRVSEIDPAWASAGIQVGDVLLRLNGQPIERPEQAQVAFESLRVASEVALELSRNGKTTTLRYRVE
jgi:S1-C subfamily serine protease